MTPPGTTPLLLDELQTSSTQINHRLAAMVAAADDWCFQDYIFRPVICQVRIEGAPRPRSLRPHTHRYCEFTFIAGARVIYFMENRNIEVAPGQIFMMPPGIGHNWRTPDSKAEQWGFMLEVGHQGETTGGWFETAARKMNYHLTPGESTLALLHLFLRDAARDKGFVPETSAAMAQAFVTSALRDVFNDLPASRADTVHQPLRRDMIVEQARSYLRSHMSSAPRASDAARHVGISVRQLHRRFLEEEGITLGEWYLNERLARAQALLATERGMPVKAVAAECGFPNVSNFCRRFGMRLGYSPGRFRERCKQ
jgi:AraC-like DNA-binding protein